MAVDSALLLMVGYRKEAFLAARRTGRPLGVWDTKLPPASVRGEFEFVMTEPFVKAPRTAMAKLGRALGERPIMGVIGVTERSVELAAALRQGLGLAGNSPETATLCRDKLAMKRRALACQIPITAFELVENETRSEDLARRLGFPLVLKERTSSGSRGLTVCHDLRELRTALRPGLLAESYIRGAEYSVESYIHAGEVRFVNVTEYYEPRVASILPAELPADRLAAAHDLNRAVIKAFGIERGLTHLEMFFTDQGVVFGEIALRPPGGYVMNLLELAYGQSAWDAFMALELGSLPVLPAGAKQVALSWILHPGPGMIANVRGLETIAAMPEVVSDRSRFKIGRVVEERLGAGDDTGAFLFAGPSRDVVVSAYESARRALVVDMVEPAS